MAQQVSLEFAGVTADQYWAVNTLLGIDMDQSENWPEGIIAHSAATTADGGLVVTEIWESQDAQGRFMDSRLGPALAEAALPPPVRVQWGDVISDVRL